MAAEHMPRLCQAMAGWAGETAKSGAGGSPPDVVGNELLRSCGASVSEAHCKLVDPCCRQNPFLTGRSRQGFYSSGGFDEDTGLLGSAFSGDQPECPPRALLCTHALIGAG